MTASLFSVGWRTEGRGVHRGVQRQTYIYESPAQRCFSAIISHHLSAAVSDARQCSSFESPQDTLTHHPTLSPRAPQPLHDPAICPSPSQPKLSQLEHKTKRNNTAQQHTTAPFDYCALQASKDNSIILRFIRGIRRKAKKSHCNARGMYGPVLGMRGGKGK